MGFENDAGQSADQRRRKKESHRRRCASVQQAMKDYGFFVSKNPDRSGLIDNGLNGGI